MGSRKKKGWVGPAGATAEPAEEAFQFAESAMLDLWLAIPPSPQAKMLTVRRGAPILPGRLELDESDLAPE
jgi:hypothetical protein